MDDKTSLQLPSETELMLQEVMDNIGVAALMRELCTWCDQNPVAAIAEQGEKE